MDQKTKTITSGIIIIALIIGAFVFVRLNKQPNQPARIVQNSQLNANQIQTQELVNPAGDTTIEGMIISIGEKEIAIGNNTPTPALFAISAKTFVVKADKDGKETTSGLSELKAGANAKVFFNEKDSAKNKEAKKIVISEK
jgi:hypothetical protein